MKLVTERQGALVSKGSDILVWDRRRPRTQFSGLMACGCCGSGFSKVTKDSFGCSAARNKGRAVCINLALIKQSDLEARVAGLTVKARARHRPVRVDLNHF